MPELRARSVAVYSFGKTLHATGLRVGYAVAPPALTTELRKVHQFNTFTIATALQQAIAGYLRERPDVRRAICRPFFQRKRDLLLRALRGSGLGAAARRPARSSSSSTTAPWPMRATCELAERLLTEAGVATIPLSVFYREPPPHDAAAAVLRQARRTR